MLLRMGEAQIIKLIVGKHVIGELEEVFSRKYPNGLRTLAILLDRCRVEVVPTSTPEILSHCLELVDFAGDAKVLAEAWGSGANCFVTLDKSHFILNKRLSEAPFKISTPGDCLAWLRHGWILD